MAKRTAEDSVQIVCKIAACGEAATPVAYMLPFYSWSAHVASNSQGSLATRLSCLEACADFAQCSRAPYTANARLGEKPRENGIAWRRKLASFAQTARETLEDTLGKEPRGGRQREITLQVSRPFS
eukprot:TRINITY_DN88595_c0_g1_i1.p1 TRINITY_DN88595_c0_g1~~TRINITY_DN88595_c0_g1_i1.p1  ORF type:complete len:126 (-),score=14.24 TRINITY_DN88595_c0_g1_i1:135-512(-)